MRPPRAPAHRLVARPASRAPFRFRNRSNAERSWPGIQHCDRHVSPPPYTLSFALGFSALALGGVHTPVLLSCATALALGATLQLRRRGSGGPSPAAGWAWAALVGYCLLQLCPVPLGWLEVVAPRNADTWVRSLRPWGEPPPAWLPLSLAPGRTWVEALKVASFGLAFYLGHCWARQRGCAGPRRLVFGCALAVAAVTLAHRAFAADSLYGWYQLADATDRAPLPNGNSRAGYLLLGLFCGLPDTLGRQRHSPLAAGGLALLGLELLLCESRSGTACLALGLVSAGLWLPWSRGPEGGPRKRRRASPARAGFVRRLSSLGLAVGAVTAVYQTVSRQGGLGGLLSDSSSKRGLLSSAGELAQDFWRFGAGRGAFGSVFPTVQTDSHAQSYEHAENFVLQWASEWGLGAAALAAGGLGLLFAGALRRVGLRDRAGSGLSPHQSRQRRCCVLGLFWLTVQNGLDLGFELPAVSMAAAALLGALGSGPATASPAPREFRLRANPAPWAVLVVSAGLCAAGSSLWGCPSLPRVRQALRSEAVALAPVDPRELPALRQAVGWFPGAPYFPLLAAGLAQQAGLDALPWAALALERAPRSVDAHRAVAEALAARGARRQALATLRLAAELPSSSTKALASSIWRVARNAKEAQAAVPGGQAGTALLAALGHLSLPPRAARRSFLQAALERAPDSLGVRLALARNWLSQAGPLSAITPKPQNRQRTDEPSSRSHALLQALALLQGHGGTDPNARVLEARVLAALGRTGASERLLRQVCRTRSQGPCPQAWLELDLSLEREAGASANAWLATACANARACSRTHRQIGQLYTKHGKLGLALRHYRQASVEAPSRAAYLELAEAAERAGEAGTAHRARQRADSLRLVSAP